MVAPPVDILGMFSFAAACIVLILFLLFVIDLIGCLILIIFMFAGLVLAILRLLGKCVLKIFRLVKILS